MKVLFLTPRFPWPPHRGDRVAALGLLRALAREHEVTLLSFVDGHEPVDALPALRGIVHHVETVSLPRWRSWLQAWIGLPSSVPSQVRYYDSAVMRRRVDEVARCAFDIVFVQMIRMAPYGARLSHPAKVLYLTDSLALNLAGSARFQPWWKQPGIAWESYRVREYEVRASRHYREAWVVSEVDAADLRARGCEHVGVVPLGVDPALADIPRGRAIEPVAAFVGNLSVPHNVDAARYAAADIWPIVRTGLPQARLLLVGADATPQVRQLATHAGVEVRGMVADLRALWPDVGVSLAPLRFASGVQFKILEAMAAGVPVVTTPVAARALGVTHGREVLVGDTAQGLASAVLDSLMHRQGALARAMAARQFVRERFGWEIAVQRLERLAGMVAPAAGQSDSIPPAGGRR